MPQLIGLEQTMSKLNTNRHDLLQNHQHSTVADVLNDSKRPSDAVIDFSICEGRKPPMQDSKTYPEPILLAGLGREPDAQPPIENFFASDVPHSTKQSRQAVDVATRLSMERHGWKQTGERSSLWAFEHRSPHRRDHAEGRNHRLQGK
jgi:hypothetical protein